MSELVVMPKADWQAALDATRAKTGKLDLIKSGDLAGEIESISAGGGGEEEVNFPKAFIEGTITEISDDTVDTVRGRAFTYLVTLTSAIFPNATSVGDYAFSNCKNLENVEIPNLISIGNYAFEYNTKLTSISFPKVESAGSRAFNYAAIENVDFPNLKKVDFGTFERCQYLTSVNTPNAETVGSQAFNMCYKLADLNLPKVTSIGTTAFTGCGKLKSVRLPATPPTLSNTNAFQGINAACVFYIPTGSLSAYQAATNWSALTSQYTFMEEDR